ncbi:SLATT domain-containing protein [Blastococcus sp. SYSU DS0541]
MAQPPKSVHELLEALEDRSFTTFKCRVRAFERIHARSRAWNTALISLATATTIAAVGLLVDGAMFGDSGPTFLAACSILSLAASLVVASLDYPGRAVRMESSYKGIQDLSSRVQAARNATANPTIDDYNDLYGTYSELVRHSENHTEADQDAYVKKRSRQLLGSSALTMLPYATLALPGWLFWRFGDWVISSAG